MADLARPSTISLEAGLVAVGPMYSQRHPNRDWRSLASLLCLLLAALFVTGSGSATGAGTTLVIGVADAASGAPVVNAQVRVPAVGRLVRTDWLGEARLRDIPRGRYTVEVRALGYAASDITLDATGDSLGAVFMLERAPVGLDTVKVTAPRVPIRLEAYEARRRMGIRRFLTDSMLQRERARDLPVLLATRLPGLSVAPGTGSLFRIVGAGGCNVAVYLDGAMYSDSSVVNALLPQDLIGVELYDMASAPPQYRRAGSMIGPGVHGALACKVLLLWSKY